MSTAAPPAKMTRQEAIELSKLLYQWHIGETARRRAAWDACQARGGSPVAERLPRPSWLHG